MKKIRVCIILFIVIIVFILIGIITLRTPNLNSNQEDMHLINEVGGFSNVQQGDLISFGLTDEQICFDSIWRVLDSEKMNTGELGMFIMTENLVAPQDETGILFNDVEEPMNNDYQGSTIQQFCEAFIDNHFTAAEKTIIKETYKSDEDFQTATTLGGRNVSVKFDAAKNILEGDKVFLLSAEEVNNINYGFSDDSSRIATYQGVAANWWLRSPHDDSFPLDVGFVFDSGWQADLYVNGFSMLSSPYTARLAVNIDTDQITYVRNSSNVEVEEQTSPVKKFAVKDEEHEMFEVSKIISIGDLCLLSFQGALSGDDEFVSAIITNVDVEITYYGTIEQNKERGIALLNLSGFMNQGDSLYVFSENVSENINSICTSDLIKVLQK